MVAPLYDFSDETVRDNDLSEGYPFQNLSTDVLNNPEATSNWLREAFPEKDGPFFIGSEIVSSRQGVLALAERSVGLIESNLVVIDCGIAHWNEVFWPVSGFRFAEIFHFQTKSPNLIRLSPKLIDTCHDLAGNHGFTAPVPVLAKQFPDSFWALPPSPDELWHGTATAALAAEAPGNLIAIELPRSLLLDWRGDSMTLTLWLMLYQAAGQLSVGFRDSPKGKILLPFGFTGGPHDGNHPAARSISLFLDAYRDVELVLPAGNHRQDRLHARLRPERPKVIWESLPDDASVNVLDLCVTSGCATFVLRAGSGGSSLALKLQHGYFCDLTLEGKLVGHVHARKVPSGAGLAVRIALEPGVTANAWEIEMQNDQAADLWILRDDPELALNFKNAEQSRFFDDQYVEQGDDGYPAMSDGPSVIKRAGTASILTTAGRAKAVAATVRRHGQDMVAEYSALPYDGKELAESWSLGAETDPGLDVVGNGSPRLFRVEGTSIAAAAFARQL